MKNNSRTAWQGFLGLALMAAVFSNAWGEPALPKARPENKPQDKVPGKKLTPEQQKQLMAVAEQMQEQILLSYVLENISNTLDAEPPQTEAADLWKQISTVTSLLSQGAIPTAGMTAGGVPLKVVYQQLAPGKLRPVLALPSDFAITYFNDPLFVECELVHNLKHLADKISKRGDGRQLVMYEPGAEDPKENAKKDLKPFFFRLTPDAPRAMVPTEVPYEEREAYVAEAVYAVARAKTQKPFTFEYAKMIEAISQKGGRFGAAWNAFVSFRTGVDMKLQEDMRHEISIRDEKWTRDGLDTEIHEALLPIAEKLKADVELIHTRSKVRPETEEAYQVAVAANRVAAVRGFLKDTYAKMKSKGLANQDYDEIEETNVDMKDTFGPITETMRSISFSSSFRRIVTYRSRPAGSITMMGLLNRGKFLNWVKDQTKKVKELQENLKKEKKDEDQKVIGLDFAMN